MEINVMNKSKLKQLSKIINELFGVDKVLVIKKDKQGNLHFYGERENNRTIEDIAFEKGLKKVKGYDRLYVDIDDENENS